MNLIGLGLVGFSAILLLAFTVIKRKTPPKWRTIPALAKLSRGRPECRRWNAPIRVARTRQPAYSARRRAAGRSGFVATYHRTRLVE